MKIYLNLDKYQVDVLFQDIHDSKQFIYVKLKLLEFLYSWNGNSNPKRPYVCIDTDDLQRAFLVNEDGCKMISFGFEFSIKAYSRNIKEANSIIMINYKGVYGFITPKDISDAISIWHSYTERNDNLYCNIEFDDEDCISPESKKLFEYIIMKEPGYIRYDYTTKGYKEWIHPVSHFDINFSKITYKLGLSNKITIQEFMAIFGKDNIKPVLNLNPNLNLSYKKRRKNRLH